VRTSEVGGNTACVEIESETTRIVLDAGTGLRAIGDRLARSKSSHTSILLSHVHWDHIQGLPFFAPIYMPGHSVEILSGSNGHMALVEALRRQMTPPFFPVPFDAVAERVTARDLERGEHFRIGDFDVRMARLDHPDPVYGYRIEHDGVTVVYATDTELGEEADPWLMSLVEGADLLIIDSQYTPEEYRGDHGAGKQGWGHSTYESVARLARRAGVGTLVLFHHDPNRSDREVAHIEVRARQLFPDTVAAREGESIDLGAEVARTAEPTVTAEAA
jgi:phosphoribosyl 1,2-cyclic phosphodiesterase